MFYCFYSAVPEMGEPLDVQSLSVAVSVRSVRFTVM